jgi:SulP family sulfate permease
MFLVVAFSSSLDVAAIEMELGTPLDYNRKFSASVTFNYGSTLSSFPPFFLFHSPGELNTVGISNLVSGLFGGYTGSYIFSQTIFSMRRGVSSTVNGYIIAVGEILVVLLPVSLTSYIPKMFFGSLLVLIAADLMFEWLIAARDKMMLSEYLVCLFTFIAIQSTNIEVGKPSSFR